MRQDGQVHLLARSRKFNRHESRLSQCIMGIL